MLKIKCIICEKEITSPKIGYLHCDEELCRDEFNANQIELWKMENPEKVKEMNKKPYANSKQIG